MSSILSAFPRFVDQMEPHEIAFQLAKSGKHRQLKQYLNKRGKDERKRIVSTKHNGATSLIMACRNGHFEVVEYLVDYCQASLEQTGLVNFENENIEGAPPLWCASAAGHLKIVKYLVSKGANVNSTTKSNSTALRAACFDGHIDIVKFLVENAADIEIANRHGHTCLMIACYKGHLAIARYLISKQADLNRKSVKGNTALHDCAECGSLDIMKLLLSHRAKMAPDAYSMTPLLAAAVTGHAQIVEYLLTRPECTPLEKVHALELLGATFVDKKHDMLSAYNYWKKALERRRQPAQTAQAVVTADLDYAVEASPDEAAQLAQLQQQGASVNLNKTATISHNPIEAYDYATEFMTQAELDQIIADPDDMRMQALLIRERILGPTHPDTTYYIRYRGAVYADCGNFRKCILLWLYALDTQQKCLEPLHPMIQSSFLSFTELFQYMQKQLSPFNGASSAANPTSAGATRDGGSPGGTTTTTTTAAVAGVAAAAAAAPLPPGRNSAENSFNILNMFTATVAKILQQAVEEIKRGTNLINYQSKPPPPPPAVESNNKSTENTDKAQKNDLIMQENRRDDQGNKQRDAWSPGTSTSGDGATSSASAADRETEHGGPSSPTATTPTTTSAPAFDMAHFDRTLVVIVHFLVVVAESLRHCSPEETFKLKKLVYELIKLNPKDSKNSTLLHLASSRDSSKIIKNHTLTSFPSTEALKLLLECGADPNALDGEHNSPLHLAAGNRHLAAPATVNIALNVPPANQQANAAVADAGNDNLDNSVNQPNPNPAAAAAAAGHPSSPTYVVNSERDKIICLLLNAGTHLDSCNIHNQTPADLYKGGKLYHVINPINYLSLQCLAAKVIKAHKIPYREHLTTKLANFVSMH